MKTTEYWVDYWFKQGVLHSTKDHPVYSWQAEQMVQQIQQDAIKWAYQNKTDTEIEARRILEGKG